MNTYTLTQSEVNLIAEAINALESHLENTLDCCSSMVSSDKKTIQDKIQKLGLISLYLQTKVSE